MLENGENISISISDCNITLSDWIWLNVPESKNAFKSACGEDYRIKATESTFT